MSTPRLPKPPVLRPYEPNRESKAKYLKHSRQRLATYVYRIEQLFEGVEAIRLREEIAKRHRVERDKNILFLWSHGRSIKYIMSVHALSYGRVREIIKKAERRILYESTKEENAW